MLAQRDRVRATREHAKFYREHGWNVLPSDPTPASEGGRKKPLVRFAQYWEHEAPADLVDRFPGCNLQVMTGARWRLAVLDLDGAEAIEHVERNWRKLPRTWTVFHSHGGRESRHLWFKLPVGLPLKGKQVLYAEWDTERGAWKKHVAVELLLDRCLVVAPPSIHIRTGNEYRFDFRPIPGSLAELPEWIWNMEAVRPPCQKPQISMAKLEETPGPIRLGRNRSSVDGRRVSSRDVLDAIHDKSAVAKFWGLRVTDRPGTDGWLQCHDFNRDDANPSAAFHPERGHFWRPGMAKVISLFSLGVDMGIYQDWREVRDDLASHYLPHP